MVLQLLNVDAKIMDIINFVFTILQMVVLSRLIAFQSRYRYTMIGWGVSMAITMMLWFLPMSQENTVIGMILLVSGLIAKLFGMYWLYQCHMRLVLPLDEDIAYRWKTLWYYECVGCVFVGLSSLFAMASVQLFMILILIALCILIIKVRKEYDNLKASEKLFISESQS